MSGRPKAQLVLTELEREELVALTLRRKTVQALALRARIVLACADGQDNKVVAVRQRAAPQTVCKWRARYVVWTACWMLRARELPERSTMHAWTQ